ncbi:gamma-tubulin complex component 5-like isoform X1 [Phoenix dactylifera]|uniref:Gamma-tubulin complex component n=2 Tax=Phoenix dactylifera TaxID=42345 RepID=A0A8B8J6X2_PHODC|nr:gamma-tubulin complex component 5-like isoform X1 [Phoenix dactylifera]XP_026662199.2 gamma-tubulin complex component 5-like isoform X1 [Phoenix dactylifera]
MRDVTRVEVSESFISKLHFSISKGLPHAEPVSTFRTNEYELVQGVLQMLQGFCSSLFFWDMDRQRFCAKDGIYSSHLSQTSLSGILNQFLFAGTCLKQVELFVKKAEASHQRAPTLKAFANTISSWLKRLHDVALKEEARSTGSDAGMITLLGLTSSLSSFCSKAEHLLQVVSGAVPNSYFDSDTSLPACDMAVHILNHLFKKLNEVCLVQGDEEEAYHMLLVLFVGSLLPYLEGLDSWLYDGTLDDPYEEMFFYANSAVTIDQPAFWEMSYLLRSCRWKKSRSNGLLIPFEVESTVHVKRETGAQEHITISSSTPRGRNLDDMDDVACPVFLKDIAKAIVSAGKSLQLVRHVQDENVLLFGRDYDRKPNDCKIPNGFNSGGQFTNHQHQVGVESDVFSIPESNNGIACCDYSDKEFIVHLPQRNHAHVMGDLTLSEVFLVSLAGLVGHGDHIYEYLRMSSPDIARMCKACKEKQVGEGTAENVQTLVNHETIWLKFLADAIFEKRHEDNRKEIFSEWTIKDLESSLDMEEMKNAAKFHCTKRHNHETVNILGASLGSFYPRNPVITVCREVLKKNMALWNELNISRSFHLPRLNDEGLREAIFGEKNSDAEAGEDFSSKGALPRINGTDYTFGFQFDELEHLRLLDETKILETLYPFPTLIPCFQENTSVSEFLPYQKNSTLASRVLKWIQSTKLKDTPQPAVIIQECLALYIKKQVDHVGRHILVKLMSDWKLMDELGVLRAIYLLGSGDLLQQFMIVIFNKLDKGDSWDDDFELNTILQESIRNSADSALLSTPDSLIVSITKQTASDDEENASVNVSTPRKIRNQYLGIDALDMLKFSYKVSWPLDLIANMEALRKYNQVMGFLLKVKRAKFVLDKARKWMWKGRGSRTHNYKHHLLLEQKLLHFVDAFHQYVMDRVFHSAWTELCTGMASAGSLDEVIEVHEAYLLSIQRQCFVAPDKLWALIASRIKTILGLALDFYTIQLTLSSGGAAPAIKARCEMEVDRIEKQFDDCIAFLLRILSFKLNVGHFPHLADLVTRINYNYFYMSDSGNLLTVPNFESSAKPGKTGFQK